MCVRVCECVREKLLYTSLDDVTADKTGRPIVSGNYMILYIYTLTKTLVITHTTRENDSNYYLVRITDLGPLYKLYNRSVEGKEKQILYCV